MNSEHITTPRRSWQEADPQAALRRKLTRHPAGTTQLYGKLLVLRSIGRASKTYYVGKKSYDLEGIIARIQEEEQS